MKKLVSILALAALVLAACGGGAGAVAATVNGANISVGDVESLIDQQQGSTITKEQFAQFLALEIQWAIIEQGTHEQWGIEIGPEEIVAEADRIYESVNANETREEFLSNRGVTEEFLLRIAHQGLLDLAVRDEFAKTQPNPSQEAIDAQIGTARASLTQACVSHILVATEAEAQEAMDRLDGGEVFGALAAELSQDPGSADNDGILPCGSPSQYVAEFRDAVLTAPVGELYETIVETQFGFHVMLVTDRVEPDAADLPTPDEAADNIKAQGVGDELTAWFLAEVAEADVTVDEKYGTWQAVPQPTVIPPAT